MSDNDLRRDEYVETIDLISRAIKEEYKNFNFTIMLPEFVLMCEGNGNYAIILSRIFYWFRPNQLGGNKFHSKLPSGVEAFAKSATEMSRETGIDSTTVKRAYKYFVEKNYIQIRKFFKRTYYIKIMLFRYLLR